MSVAPTSPTFKREGVAARLASYLSRYFRQGAVALSAEEAVAHIQGLLTELRVDPDLPRHFSLRTFRYYRSRHLISPPDGATFNARYRVRHILEGATARLAGHLAQTTLEEAAATIPSRPDAELQAMLVDLVVAEWADREARTRMAPRPLPSPRSPHVSSSSATTATPRVAGSATTADRPVAAPRSLQAVAPSRVELQACNTPVVGRTLTVQLPEGVLAVVPTNEAGKPAVTDPDAVLAAFRQALEEA